MSFNLGNLSQAWDLPPGNGGNSNFQNASKAYEVWNYDAGSDTIADIESLSTPYFPFARLPLRPGDLVQVSASDGKALYRVDSVPTPIFNIPLQFKKIADVSAFAGSTFYPLLVVSPYS